MKDIVPAGGAGNFIHAIGTRRGLPTACPEEIPYGNGWMLKEELRKKSQTPLKTEYGQHIMRMIET